VSTLSGHDLPEVARLFARLCEIASPSGEEGAMADAVLLELSRMGADITQDDAATALPNAGCNNIVARFAPTTEGTPIMFCAHLDTVPLLAPVEVVQEGEWLTNRNEAILGGDDKAAVAAMLHAVDRVVHEGIPHAGIELVFTPCEEVGLKGAAYFDPSVLRAAYGFVYDHTGELGGIVASAPTHKEIHVTVRGVAAHAGIQPELGRSAITAASRAIASMPLGRIDEATTANIGTVRGGSATNVVAEECVIAAECRSRDPEALGRQITAMLDAFTWAGTECECDVEISVRDHFTGYSLDEDAPQVVMAAQALGDCGIAPRFVASGGGSDVNALLLNGFPAVNLCNAMVDVHTPDERIRIADVQAMVDVTLAIIARARGLS
jgi:tripeptide aminopeptidase